MMQVMLGMLPMLVKEMNGGKGGKDLNSERGGKISGRKGRTSGEKYLEGERGEKIFGRKREIFSGGTGPRGQWGQDLKREKGKKTLRREGWRSWGEKALGGKRGKGS